MAKRPRKLSAGTTCDENKVLVEFIMEPRTEPRSTEDTRCLIMPKESLDENAWMRPSTSIRDELDETKESYWF